MKQVAPFRHRSHLCPLGQTSTFQTLMDGPIFSLWFMTLFIRLIRLKVAIVRMLPHTVDVMDVLILCWSSSSRQSSHLRQKGPTAAAGMPSVHQTNPIDRRIPTDSSFYFFKKKVDDEVRSWASGRTNSGPKWTRVGRSAPLYAPSNRIARQLKGRSHLTVVKVVKRGKCRSKKKIFPPSATAVDGRPIDRCRPWRWEETCRRWFIPAADVATEQVAYIRLQSFGTSLGSGDNLHGEQTTLDRKNQQNTCRRFDCQGQRHLSVGCGRGAEADRPEFDGWRSSVTWYCSLRVEEKKERPTGGASWIEWAVADPTGDTFVTTCGAQKPSVTGRML